MISKGSSNPLKGCNIVDDHTVDIKTKKPYALLLNMATYIFPMDSKFYTGTDDKGQPKDAIVKIGESFALNNASGTGPFIVTNRAHRVVSWRWTRFRRLLGQKVPGQRHQDHPDPHQGGRHPRGRLLSGDVDFISPVPPRISTALKETPRSNLFTYQRRPHHHLPDEPEAPSRIQETSRVRQAIVHAVNNEGIVQKIMKNKATVAAQQGPEGYAGYKRASPQVRPGKGQSPHERSRLCRRLRDAP
jgi:peptide/nickel transport system substrate-binding protein